MWDLHRIVIPKVQSSWKDLAYALGFDKEDVMGLKGDFTNSAERCHCLFENWLSGQHSNTPKTWRELLKQIKDCDDLIASSKEIEKNLMTLRR